MNRSRWFSWSRWWSIVIKEVLQLRRDRVSLGMIVGVPILQLALFGFAINSDPRHLPTAVIVADHSEFSRSLVAAMQTSTYFDVIEQLSDEEAGRAALAQGRVQFVLNVPVDFSARLLRGERPALLLEADAADPSAAASALAVLPGIVDAALAKDLRGPLAALASRAPAYSLQVHRLYNPEGITQYNIVPGLMGVILTMTLVMMTGLTVTRERERGTMENLLAMPARPLEVITGKIMPYILIGLIQISIILLAAHGVFHVPFAGSLAAVYLSALLFIAANLAVGITMSSLAQNQMQAMQMTMFYFLPNILLSGFMFPFRGMPDWAQVIGSVLPLTHFNRLVRGILLKGNGWPDLWPDVWPIVLFTVVVMVIALRFYRRTLD